MELEKIGKFDFQVEEGQTEDGHLTLSAMVSKMLDVACRHADERGFGLGIFADKDAFRHRQITWVMSRLAYEIYEMPAAGEPFTIVSWVENIYRQFTNRCFEIQNKEGKVIGYARSIWAMIDMESRKSIDLHELYGENLEHYASDRSCPIEGPARIRMTAPEQVAEYPVVEADIDFNGHVNSVRYIEHILSLFKDSSFHPTGNVSRLDIAYVTEALLGDTLRYFIQKDAEDLYSVEIKNQKDQVICRTLLKFS